MTIRVKLLWSYTIMLVITLTIQLSMIYLIAAIITDDWYIYKNFYKYHFAVKPLSQTEYRIAEELKKIATDQPEALTKATVQKKWDKLVEAQGLGLIIRKKQDILFSSHSYRWSNETMALPPYEPANLNVRNSLFVNGRLFSYLKYDFVFPDQEAGSIYLLKERNPIADIMTTYGPVIAGALFLLLVLTNVFFNYFLSRKVFARLKGLEHSTRRIQAGDLDTPVESTEVDEIGQLCRAFEDMRIRLKETIQIRLSYEQSRKELISHISHDLKTPITSIKGYIEGLQDGVANTPEKQAKYLATIKQKAEDLNQRIEDLFLFSKLDLEQYPYHFQSTLLPSYLRACFQEMQMELLAQNAEVIWESEREVEVYVDRDQMKRVILNIIQNSIAYRKEESLIIHVGYDVKEDDVLVRISDNGQGISEKDLPFVLDQFYRVEPSRNSNSGGSGIGLAIAKQIVEGHDGQIKVYSQWQQGTMISFTLPRYMPNRHDFHYRKGSSDGKDFDH
ncbi:sensor histidine kinase [Shimazuella kribbensis]|uniref:sensor histidine kinase n=1 Tax=Shimazuella kribbensis TaxID=139808 RepID=UPI001470C9ED|nr:HAMP domain-containing sensor histidine kinase [Shimazuella kribbensis]